MEAVIIIGLVISLLALIWILLVKDEMQYDKIVHSCIMVVVIFLFLIFYLFYKWVDII